MPRTIVTGAAQLGPINRADGRKAVVDRLMALLRQAKERGCSLVVFPELALTTFFPRWWMEDQKEIDSYYEREMPGPETRRLFDAAKDWGIGFYLGYAELTKEGRRFNTSILVDPKGKIIGKYRKIHLPGHADHRPKAPFQHLEKKYFEVGDLGFNVWRTPSNVWHGGTFGMAICNDRRWPETYRVMGLQGAEMIMLGFNTPDTNMHFDEPLHLRMFHHRLSCQAGAYQNASWVVATAKAGREDGFKLFGGSLIVAPTGEIAAEAMTEEDELITAPTDLDFGNNMKRNVFNFAAHRRIEHYKLITERTGAEKPTELAGDD